MEYEKDYIQREVQKLTLFLQKLIGKISGENAGIDAGNLGQLNEDLKARFDFSLNEIINVQRAELPQKVSGMHDEHLAKLIELLYIVNKKVGESETNLIERKKLIQTNLLLIEILDDRSKVFSTERMRHKEELQQLL